MKKNLNQGSAHVVVIICLVTALLCALGIVFYQNFVLKQQSEQKTQVSVSSTKKTAPTASTTDKKTLEIPGWGVKVALPTDGTQITYYKKSGRLGEYYDFSTKAVEAIGGECATGFSGDGGTPARMGTLLRMKTKDTTGASAPIPLNGGAPIDGYYYYYSSPQSTCGGADPTEAQTKAETTAVSTIEAMLKTIEKA